jgi:hypothetical protein
MDLLLPELFRTGVPARPFFAGTGVPVDFLGRPLPLLGVSASCTSSSESESPFTGIVVVVVRSLLRFTGARDGEDERSSTKRL